MDIPKLNFKLKFFAQNVQRTVQIIKLNGKCNQSHWKRIFRRWGKKKKNINDSKISCATN